MATIAQETIDGMTERKNKLSQLMIDAGLDPMIDFDLLQDLFRLVKDELETWKYTGKVEYLQTVLETEKLENNHWLGVFLNWDTYLELNILDVIIDRLS